jgi:hypothetical protein
MLDSAATRAASSGLRGFGQMNGRLRAMLPTGIGRGEESRDFFTVFLGSDIVGR